MDKSNFNKNNLFQFAPSELSQDAIISWIFNNYNYRADNEELYNLSKLVIRKILDDKTFKINQPIKIIRQYHHIDVLLILNDEIAIIIEDKTYESERADQIARYKQALLDGVEDNEYKLPKFKEENIRTVYLKTGYHYPIDQEVQVDCKINGEEWYNILARYEGESEILDDYLKYLKNSLEYYSDIKTKYQKAKVTPVLSTYYGQYLLLKDMFGQLDSFSHGSSRGVPWSNHVIEEKMPYIRDNQENIIRDNYTIFCRIDKNSKGYYASMRQYDRQIDKLQSKKVDQKKEEFYKLRKIFSESCDVIEELQGGLARGSYKLGGNNGGYYESEFGVFFIGDQADQMNINEFPTIFKKFLIEFKDRLEKRQL